MVTADRTARANRLAPYFETQLRFAARMAELLDRPLGQVAFEHTNLNRRLGLGFAGAAQITEAWLAYVERLAAAADLPAKVAVTQATFEESADEVLPRPGQTAFGCFAHDPPDTFGEVRIHFFNLDTDDQGGPIASAKVGRRRRELAAMVASIREKHPQAHTIRGGSWLYNIEAYRRLFPPDYIASCGLKPGPLRLTGTSVWGQLIDSREAIRPQVRDALMANLATLDPQAPWTAFPHRVLAVHAPIECFVRFYDL